MIYLNLKCKSKRKKSKGPLKSNTFQVLEKQSWCRVYLPSPAAARTTEPAMKSRAVSPACRCRAGEAGGARELLVFLMAVAGRT